MLNSSQKEKIRSIKIYKLSCSEVNGKPIDEYGEEFVIPSFPEIEQSIIQKIRQLGFSKIERVSPSKANCIIRVYQKLHYEYYDDYYNLYGASCYTLKNEKWTEKVTNGEFEIDYSKHKVGHIVCQDERIIFDCNFFDCYVKIS